MGGSTGVSTGSSTGTLNITLSTVNAMQGPATCSGDLAVTGALTGPTVTGLQQQIQTAAGGSALATRVTAAESRIDTVNGSLGNLSTNTQIVALQTQLTAAVAVNTAQDTSITAIQTKNSQQDTSISSLQTTATQNSTNITALQTRATSIESKNSQQDTAITALQVKNAEQDASVAAQSTSTNGFATRLSALESTDVIRAQLFLKSMSVGTDTKRLPVSNAVLNGALTADTLYGGNVFVGSLNFFLQAPIC